MACISFEIVPRSLDAFQEQYQFVQTLGSAIQIINVPDIQRFSIRSWELSAHVDQSRYQFIPHFRAIDFKVDGEEICKLIDQYQLSRIMLVTGDPPEGIKRKCFNTNVVDLIRVVKKRYPQLTVYAGFDPHRQGIQDECDYIHRKLDAGADGFFSQPFYDMRLVDIYTEHMQGLNVYIGLSPITTQASQHYWEVKNKVKFPKHFRADYQWNIEFANKVLQSARDNQFNIYFMPIKIDLSQFFSGLVFS